MKSSGSVGRKASGRFPSWADWVKFSYNYKGMMKIDSVFLMDTLVEQLGNALDDMLVAKGG